MLHAVVSTLDGLQRLIVAEAVCYDKTRNDSIFIIRAQKLTSCGFGEKYAHLPKLKQAFQFIAIQITKLWLAAHHVTVRD